MSDNWTPLPDDPDAAYIGEMFDAKSADWILTDTGDYQTAAAEAMREDGSGLQKVVVLEWPGRRNHTTERITVRLMMRPDDAIGLGEILIHTGKWMKGKGLS